MAHSMTHEDRAEMRFFSRTRHRVVDRGTTAVCVPPEVAGVRKLEECIIIMPESLHRALSKGRISVSEGMVAGPRGRDPCGSGGRAPPRSRPGLAVLSIQGPGWDLQRRPKPSFGVWGQCGIVLRRSSFSTPGYEWLAPAKLLTGDPKCAARRKTFMAPLEMSPRHGAFSGKNAPILTAVCRTLLLPALFGGQPFCACR